MNRLRLTIVLLAVIAFAVLGSVLAQDDPPPQPAAESAPGWQTLQAVLPYLSSRVPEQRLQAERLVERGAREHFEKLVEEMPAQPRRGREVLLRVLAHTEHEGRVRLCLDTLCNRESRRAERTIASRGLKSADQDKLLALIEQRLAEPELELFQRIECCNLLGTLSSARGQGVAEQVLAVAEPGSLLAFAAEDAVLRSTIASPFAQPAWSRYQDRRPQAPRLALRQLQDALDELALPRAVDRAAAELQLGELVGKDVLVLLALARSPWPERATFALNQLKRLKGTDLALATQAVMLDVVMTGEQTVALLAMDVAIAGTPPSDADMEKLRPVISVDSEARLEAILEGMGRNTDLAELRATNRALEAKLRPLLQRRGPADSEVLAMFDQLQSVRAQLDQVEALWAGGWRREFEAEILGTRQE